MKKLLPLLMCIVLIASCAAQAAGLPAISGGKLPQINAAQAGDAGVLPDPAKLLESKGEIFAKDYAYGVGYTCTVYTYELPANNTAFTTAYQIRAKANGFTVESTNIEGFAALKLSYGDKYALLFPDYSGVVMLMVENGMIFGEPMPDGNYIQFTRNGRTITSNDPSKVTMKKGTGYFNMGEAFEIDYYFHEEPVTLFSLKIPASSIEGDIYQVDKNNTAKCLALYTSEDEFLVFYENDYDDKMVTSQDYFTLEITKMTKNESYVQVEGVFEGCFNGGKTTYENGSFRAEMYR